MKYTIYLFLLLLLPVSLPGQREHTDANLVGHVTCNGEHIPFASVFIGGTTIGTVTDETGHYRLVNLPAGTHTVQVKMVGYTPVQKQVKIYENHTLELNFELEEDVLNLEEVVVSANRSDQKRTEAPVIVTTLSPKTFYASESVTLGEGLNFAPGLRLENNCQNCGFTQVRMNGMEGPYSQILINSRPIFSGLASVYGMELIPANMIERVEIVRGGGSALYGSNAIAGTINVILKEPNANMYEAGATYALVGAASPYESPSPEYNFNFNTSMASADNRSGITLYGFTRDKEMFDANSDGFSEISDINNTTFGSRFFHRTGYRGKLAFDFFTINETRAGGSVSDQPYHEREIAEALEHDLKTAAITYEQYFREYDHLSVFASGQLLNRESYFGANRSLADYGNTRDRTYHVGAQYKAVFTNAALVSGLESTGSFLVDKKLGYPDLGSALIYSDSMLTVPHLDGTLVANQSSITTGAFTQYQIKSNRSKLVVGARLDRYTVSDRTDEAGKISEGNVFSPRFSYMYEILPDLKARFNYSHGYRAPQIYDEDLHIETSGSRKVINQNDPGLSQETSHSAMVSLDFNGLMGDIYTGILVEGFYTRLLDPFVNEIGMPDENGTVIYTRVNSDQGATVKGINFEYKAYPASNLEFLAGYTLQSSLYDKEHEFNERRFFRTPDSYGYFSLEYDPVNNICINLTGNYTGSMLVPYFGPEAMLEGELRRSDPFFDLGTRVKNTVKINGSSVQIFGGVKNLLNAYQSDFDPGINRDPSYIYGPVAPRTIYAGLKFGNFLD